MNATDRSRIDDEHDIACLLMRWGHARDSDDWEALAACFHDGATIHISWISGPATEFVERSRALAGTRAPGHHTKHLIAGPKIDVRGDRAASICHANLYVRRDVAGVEVDIESWIRFFDLLERRAGRWGIVKRTGVYEKDRMSAVDPAGFPAGFWDGVDLSQFPASSRFLNFSQAKAGRQVMTDLVSVYSDGEAALRAEASDWLAGS